MLRNYFSWNWFVAAMGWKASGAGKISIKGFQSKARPSTVLL